MNARTEERDLPLPERRPTGMITKRRFLQRSNILSSLRQAPAIVLIVFVFTVMALAGGRIMGYSLTGIAWVVPLVAALLILARQIREIRFPFILWLPWGVFLMTQLLFADYASLDERVIPFQRTVQLLTPVFVGMAASTYRPSESVLEAVTLLCRYFVFVLIALVAVKTGIVITGRLPEVTGLAPEVMTVILLCTFFASRYTVSKEKRDLQFWGILAMIPFIAVTRTAIAVTLLTFPLNLGRIQFAKRLLIVVLIFMLSLVAFYSTRVQKKMFYSGKGEISDVASKDFATSGRSFMWTQMLEKLEGNYVEGFGTGAAESFVYRITGKTCYPHNDWLLTLYDYGLVGVTLYAITLLATVAHALKSSKLNISSEARTLFLAGASAMIPFSLMMITDNIMVYSSFFGNLQFMFLGLAYGALHSHLGGHSAAKRPA